jgi:hypothetical protein
MKDYAVISLHEKGFWQIDVYWKMEQPPIEGDVPDHFKTCKIGEPIDAATRWAKDWYPNAEVLIDEEDDADDADDEDESAELHH